MNFGSQQVCAYFDDVGNCIEYMADHASAVYCIWEECMKRYYKQALRRAFSNYADLIISIALLLHDFGKLVKAYTDVSLRRYYRHELLSAYFTYEVLKPASFVPEDYKLITSLAVLLHHEPIILSAYASELGEQYIKASTVKVVLERVSAKGKLQIINDLQYINFVNSRLLRHGLNLNQVLLSVNPKSVINTLKEVLAFASLGDNSIRLVRRAKVGALLHPLTLADSLAAEMQRHGSGTWVTKRALGGAEPGDLVICITRCVQGSTKITTGERSRCFHAT